jgi:cysteine desulfuration protein SufE
LIPTKLRNLLNEINSAPESETRAEMLIEISRQFESVPESVARRPYSEDRKVPGCESEVYVFSSPLPDHTLKFYFAVENPQGISAKAIAVILDEGLSGVDLQEVAQLDTGFVHEIFGKTLSMGKGQGLMNMAGIVRTMAANQIGARR